MLEGEKVALPEYLITTNAVLTSLFKPLLQVLHSGGVP